MATYYPVLPVPTQWTNTSAATTAVAPEEDSLRLGENDEVVVVVASLVARCLDRVAFLLGRPRQQRVTSLGEEEDDERSTTAAAAERDALDEHQMRKVAELPVDIKERLWAMMVHRGQLSPSALEHFVANRGSFRFSDFAPFVIGAGASGADGMTAARQFIGVGQLMAIVGSTCPELSELDLSGCTDLLDDQLSLLLNSASLRRTLRSVSLAECIKLTDKSVLLLSHCGQLRFLDLSGNFELTDKSLIVILNKISSLHHIALRDCAGISANVTRQLAKNDASVHTLDLSGVKLQSIFTAQKTKEATWQQLRDLRLQRCVLSLPIIKDLSCLPGLLSLDVTGVVGVASSLMLDTICTSLTRLESLTLGGMEVMLASLKRLFATNVSIKRLALSCEIKVEPQGHGDTDLNNKKTKGGNAATNKKQSQFQQAKQIKIKKERRHASPREKNAVSTNPEAETKREPRDEDEDEDELRRPLPRRRQHGNGDDGESQLVYLSLRGSSVATRDHAATVINTLLLGDTPLPRLTFLDLCSLFPHAHPSMWTMISLLPNLRRLRLIDFVFHEEHELLDLSVTKRRQPFAVASATNYVHYRGMSLPPVRRPYNPSFGYALPFHFPPTLVTLILRGWIYEHAPDETLLHRDTVSDVYRGVQDSGGGGGGERRGHAVEVVQGPPVTEPETSGAFVLGTTPLCE